jgi:hypothetical protein
VLAVAKDVNFPEVNEQLSHATLVQTLKRFILSTPLIKSSSLGFVKGLF